MNLVKLVFEIILYSALFYAGLGFLISFHGLHIPDSAFTIGGVITILVYMFVMIVNYRL